MVAGRAWFLYFRRYSPRKAFLDRTLLSMPGNTPTKKRRLSLSIRTLIGLADGIACGAFFGEHCGWLRIFGDAFVGLLQMTVLPYNSLSLIASVGRMPESIPQKATWSRVRSS